MLASGGEGLTGDRLALFDAIGTGVEDGVDVLGRRIQEGPDRLRPDVEAVQRLRATDTEFRKTEAGDRRQCTDTRDLLVELGQFSGVVMVLDRQDETVGKAPLLNDGGAELGVAETENFVLDVGKAPAASCWIKLWMSSMEESGLSTACTTWPAIAGMVGRPPSRAER